MDYFVGLDVSLRSAAVCEIDDISGCLADLPACNLRIGFEAGAMSQHLVFGLQAAGFDVVCMEARQVNAALLAMRNSETEAQMIQ